MLKAESVCRTYPTRSGDLVVLRDASFALDVGQSAAIVGPSGSGKSTLLNILGTLESPTSGRVLFDDVDPFSLGPPELARFRNLHVGFIFQDHHLLPQCSVLENVLLPTLAQKADADDATARASVLLARVGLSERIDHCPAELSGGERQRVAVARALMNRPTLVLADEPTGNLDARTAESIGALLAELHGDQPLILIVVTHSPALADRFGRKLELVDGTLVPR